MDISNLIQFHPLGIMKTILRIGTDPGMPDTAVFQLGDIFPKSFMNTRRSSPITAGGFMNDPMVMSGCRLCTTIMIGDPIIMAAGYGIRSSAGIGSPTNPGAGVFTTTADGTGVSVSDGTGFPLVTGVHRGSIGTGVAITSAGVR